VAASGSAQHPPREHGVQRLALAVLERALVDACEDSVRGTHARHWLRQESEGRTFWCTCAGVDARQLQRTLARLEAAGWGPTARALLHAVALEQRDNNDGTDLEGAA
jgi:hypothetical protein